MTWIKTIPTTETSEELRKAIDGQKALYPIEYATPVHPTDGTSAIVASHSLMPEALYHAFAAFGAMMSPNLPLTRREHEITLIASWFNYINRVADGLGVGRESASPASASTK